MAFDVGSKSVASPRAGSILLFLGAACTYTFICDTLITFRKAKANKMDGNLIIERNKILFGSH